MNDLVKSEQQLAERLTGTLQRRSLADLVKARTQVSTLLVDCSGSMGGYTDLQERKIDALRKVVTEVVERVPAKIIQFGSGDGPSVVDPQAIPEPSGGTPLAEGIGFSKAQQATHLIVICDGYPDDRHAALFEAQRFGGQIDTVYVGPKDDVVGREFMAELARLTGGASDHLDLAQKALVARTVIGLLGAGQPQLERGSAIQL